MTKAEFSVIAQAMKAVYAGRNFLPDTAAMDVWYCLLCDLDAGLVTAAVQRHMMTERMPPSIADIREQCLAVSGTDEEDWLAGWRQAQKVMSRYGYNRPKEAIAALSAFDERAGRVAEMLGWQNLCLSENPTADRANFRDCYVAMKGREREAAKLPQAFQKLVGSVAEKMMLSDK